MKRYIAFLLALAVIFAAGDVFAQSPAQPNGKVNTHVLPLVFATSNALKDTLIDVETSKNTQQFSLMGTTGAILVTKIYIEEGDQSDTVEVNVAVSLDGTTWSSRVAIDSILVTAADADTSLYNLDLLGATVDAALLAVAGKTFLPLENYPRVRLSFDSISLASTDTLHVFPTIVKTYDTR